MKLYLDTSDTTSIVLKDDKNNMIDQCQDDLRFCQSEKLLQMVDNLLNKNNLNKKSLKNIVVNCGPGSYTGIRVGVTTANFLAFGLDIPVFCDGKEGGGKRFVSPVSAKYLHQPFITKKRI